VDFNKTWSKLDTLADSNNKIPRSSSRSSEQNEEAASDPDQGLHEINWWSRGHHHRTCIVVMAWYGKTNDNKASAGKIFLMPRSSMTTNNKLVRPRSWRDSWLKRKEKNPGSFKEGIAPGHPAAPHGLRFI
jgi:hypothetical protein